MSEMRLLGIDVCPVWEEPDGRRTIGMEEREDPPPIIGWSAVSTILLGGETYRVLLNLEALQDDDDATLDEW